MSLLNFSLIGERISQHAILWPGQEIFHINAITRAGVLLFCSREYAVVNKMFSTDFDLKRPLWTILCDVNTG
jgi:hypothetical protein